MDVTNPFLESLHEIMEDYDIGVAGIADRIGCNKSAVRRWLYDMYYPEPRTLVKLADAFSVSADYLFGLSDHKDFVRCDSEGRFYERYLRLKKLHSVTDYKVSRECDIQSSTISKWKETTGIPATSTLIKLAAFFRCSLDFLLGRGSL